MNPAVLGLLGMFGGSSPSLPNRGPFQCGLFQPNVFQNDCSAAPEIKGTIIGGGFYPQPSNTPEWLARVPRKARRQIERTARAVDRGELEAEAAEEELKRLLKLVGIAESAEYERALREMLAHQVLKITELTLVLVREDQARAAQQKQNALRILLLASLQ